MSGGMDMFTQAAMAEMQRITGSGQSLAGSARALHGRLGAGEGGIGADEIGLAIQAAYFPARDAVMSAADRMPGEYDGAAAAGVTSVDDYAAVDQDNAARLRESGGSADQRA